MSFLWGCPTASTASLPPCKSRFLKTIRFGYNYYFIYNRWYSQIWPLGGQFSCPLGRFKCNELLQTMSFLWGYPIASTASLPPCKSRFLKTIGLNIITALFIIDGTRKYGHLVVNFLALWVDSNPINFCRQWASFEAAQQPLQPRCLCLREKQGS